MKKITLILLSVLSATGVFGQANILIKAPQGNNATTQVRAPNGNSSHTTMRGCFLVTAAELTPYMLPGTNISSFGFTLSAGVTGTACTGNFTVYLENTNDNSYLKGTSFTTAIAPMTLAYNGMMTVPISAASTSISVTLSSPFTYTGGGLYVAYDWMSSGPFSPTVATYQADNSLANGGATNSTSVTPASDLLGATAFRPVFLWGAPNTATNDAQVVAVEVPGSIAGILNAPHTIKGIVKNGSNVTMSNIPVSVNVTGANTYANTLTITSLAAGAQTTVNFPGFNPQVNGLNTISVTVPTDQLPINDGKSFTQSVTCNVMGQNPHPATYTSGVGFATNSGIIGAKLIPPVTATCIGTRIGLSSDGNSTGKSVWTVLLSNSGTILANSNTVVISPGMLGTFQTFTFATPVNVTSGITYYVGLAQPATPGGFWPVGTTPSPYVPAGLYVTTFTSGGFPGTLTQNLGYMALEAMFANTSTISATPSSTSVCSGYSVNLFSTGANTYTWSTGQTGAPIVVTPTGTSNNYTVTGTTALGCTASNTLSVGTTPSPTITTSSSNSVMCAGATSSLTASGADTYSWSTSGTTSVIAVTPSVTSTYTATGTNTTTGCSATSTIMVTIDSPSISISSPTAICSGTIAALAASGANSYTWSTGSTFSAVAVSPTTTSTYMVTGVNSTGCTGTQTVQVIVHPNPTFTVTPAGTPTLCTGNLFTVTAIGTEIYQFKDPLGAGGNFTMIPTSSISVVYNPTVTSTYTVVGTNTLGCSVTKTVTVNVLACVGMNEFSTEDTRITVFPNPGSGEFDVTIESFSEELVIKVYNVSGALVKEQRTSGSKTRVELSDEASGIYLVRVTLDGKSLGSARIIKTR
jgi:hypothetical protein